MANLLLETETEPSLEARLPENNAHTNTEHRRALADLSCRVCRWMFSGKQKQAAQINDARAVELQAFYRSAPRWCLSKHQQIVLTPSKMFCPLMPSQVIQGSHFLCFRVRRFRADKLFIVALLAGKRQIVQCAASLLRTRDDMLYGKTTR